MLPLSDVPARSRRGTLLIAALLTLTSCTTAPTRREDASSAFVARQYFQRGRAAWAGGNEANARFLIGRAIELDPASEALAFWQARWPVDSLPAPARAALEARAEAPPAVAAAPEAEADTPPAVAPRQTPGRIDEARAAGDSAEAAPSPEAPTDAPEPSDERPRDVALEDLIAARAGEGGAEAPAPGPAVTPEELAARRTAFESARGRGRPAELLTAGRALVDAWPQHLPTVHRVLSAWIDGRANPDAAEARVRDLLGSLEFGDTAYLAGKPEDVGDAEWLRVWRGRFLDLLGWAAFLRGDLAQAEAALRSAENEINLRGPGDVTHLRHLSSFYERRGDLGRAETYAIAAAARDASGSGEVRAAAARLWTRRHRSTTGLDSRLHAEAERVRREERSAAVANRLYQALPQFSAAAPGGAALTDASLRGRVIVVVLWEPGCEQCLRLLQDLAATPPGGRGTGGRASVDLIALDVGGDAPAASRAAGRLHGVTTASVSEPGRLLRGLDARDLPVTLVVEPAGFIQYRHSGYPGETTARQRWRTRLEWQVEGLRGLSDRPAASPSRARRGAASGAPAL